MQSKIKKNLAAKQIFRKLRKYEIKKVQNLCYRNVCFEILTLNAIRHHKSTVETSSWVVRQVFEQSLQISLAPGSKIQSSTDSFAFRRRQSNVRRLLPASDYYRAPCFVRYKSYYVK